MQQLHVFRISFFHLFGSRFFRRNSQLWVVASFTYLFERQHYDSWRIKRSLKKIKWRAVYLICEIIIET